MDKVKLVIKYLVSVIVAALSLIPFYILVMISFSSTGGLSSDKLNLLPNINFNNYVQVWKVSNIGTAIWNSTVITVGAVLLTVVFSSSAGYAIARFKNKMNTAILYILVGCMMIPGIINTVPLYSLMKGIGGINTHWAMICVCATNTLPFSVFLYTGFIRGVPREVEESAIMDGCTWFSAFFRITFHFLKPVTAAVVILNGLGIWNNYAQAVFFLQSQKRRTIPLAISMFFQQYGAKWNLMAAAAVIGVLPAVMVFLVFQKYFIKGITSGAVKG